MMRAELIRFGVVGAGLNVVLYAAYLILSALPISSIGAMTVTFFTGTVLGFFINRKLTFRYDGGSTQTFMRFFAVYALLYAVNFTALWFFAERLAFPHQFVQAVAMMVLPAFSFLLQKYWVFRPPSTLNDQPRSAIGQ
jgi:putative flippase GtrA